MKTLIINTNDIYTILLISLINGNGSSFIIFDNMFFLENYNIYNQYKLISDQNINLLDFSNTLNMYVTEAKLFVNQETINKVIKLNSFGNCPYLMPLPSSDPNKNFDWNTLFKGVGRNLPTLPQEYFKTGKIDLNNWKDNPDYYGMVYAVDYLNKLPEWLYPQEITKTDDVDVKLYKWLYPERVLEPNYVGSNVKFYKLLEIYDLHRLFPFEYAAKARVEEFKFLIEGQGFIIDNNGQVIGKWTLCYDIGEFYELCKYTSIEEGLKFRRIRIK